MSLSRDLVLPSTDPKFILNHYTDKDVLDDTEVLEMQYDFQSQVLKEDPNAVENAVQDGNVPKWPAYLVCLPFLPSSLQNLLIQCEYSTMKMNTSNND